ncbi:MAG: ATP-dependent RecD-like DNA helicase [Bradymonadia bacterium]
MSTDQPDLGLDAPLGDPLPDGEVVVEGTLDRFVFTNDEQTYAVARIRPDEGHLITAVGALQGLEVGDRVRLSGVWAQHPKHGAQLKVEYGFPLMPYTVEGIQNYLGAGHVPGIGPGLAERLVAAFGVDTLEVIEHHPDRLAEVDGIGPVRSTSIQQAFRHKKLQREVLIFLQGHLIPPALAARIWRRYGGQAISIVRGQPYRLAEEISGVGFTTADRIARALGFAVDAPMRAEAAVVHLLKAAAEEGHVYQPAEQLTRQADQMLGRPGAAAAALETLVEQGRALADPEGAIYLPHLLASEQAVARRLGTLATTSVQPWAVAYSRYEAEAGVTLSPGQRQALQAMADAPVLVITGGPGTGKTTVIKGMVAQAELNGARLRLAAPTGRASRRLAEATGHEASTLHRLLNYSARERTFKRGLDHPIAADLVVVDEISMVDLELFEALVKAVPIGCRLVLVGDADQLPSVGPGQVLADLLAAGLASVRLAQVFRQAEASHIVTNAHRVLQGAELVSDPPGPGGEFFTVPAQSPEEALGLISRLVSERIPQAFGLDPVADVQVLTPMHRGGCGAEALNEALQAHLNAEGRIVGRGSRPFRVGDKVMQVRNDYEREVFNGDIGQVEAPIEGGLLVRFDDRVLEYDFSSLDALTLAYACSIHKSQGSEYPAVIVPVLTEHWVMLRRNLLYTAITRARRLVVLVGQQRAISRAINHQGGSPGRASGLARRLAHLQSSEHGGP